MSKPKPDGLLQDSIEVGCGVVIRGHRWLVKSADFITQSNPTPQSIMLTLEIVPWESIDPTLYRIKPKRRSKAKGGQSK